MRKADEPFGVNDATQGHPSELKEVHFLPVTLGDQAIWVGQPNKGDRFILPVLPESGQSVRSYGYDFHAATREPLIIIPQTRQLRAAVGSHEAAQKGKEDRPPAEIRQATTVALHIVQLKIGRKLSRRNEVCHWLISFKNCTVASTACRC